MQAKKRINIGNYIQLLIRSEKNPIFQNIFSSITIALKKLIIAFTVISACSSPTERDLLIMDREQRIDGIKTDLNMKIISSEDIGFYTGADSLNYLLKVYHHYNLDSVISYSEGLIEYYKGRIKELEESDRENIDRYIEWIRTEQSIIDQILNLRNNKDKIYWKKVKYIYKINNPQLNMINQELTKIYVFTLDESRIISVLL